MGLSKYFPAEAIRTLTGNDLTQENLEYNIENDFFRGGGIVCSGPAGTVDASLKSMRTKAGNKRKRAVKKEPDASKCPTPLMPYYISSAT